MVANSPSSTAADWGKVTAVLRPRGDRGDLATSTLGAAGLSGRFPLRRQQLGEMRGCHPDDLAAVRAWARSLGLTPGELGPSPRSLRMSGPLGRLAAELAVNLVPVDGFPGQRAVEGQIRLPEALGGALVAVLGLDTRPLAVAHFRPLPLPPGPLATTAPLSYQPPQVADIYQFPATAATGICIGLVELGGGYLQSDLDGYFGGLGLPTPKVVVVGVDGAGNAPGGGPDGPDGEVTLDLELAGSIAPGASLAGYFAPNTDQGFMDAVSTAVHDQVNRPAVISISWGGPESAWQSTAMDAFDQVLQDAALAGITVCVATGDQGSSDGVDDGLAHVDFPASSPHSLACGGTRLVSSGETVQSEVVWDELPQGGATGGGISAQFPLPAWQEQAGVPTSVDPGAFRGRGIPDVAADADPETGYRVLVDGQSAVFGGTSAAAPLWAALIARCAAAMGRDLGYLNPLLYQTLAAEGVTRDITSGNNGAYRAGPGWDACSGWGSPLGTRLLAALQG